VQIRIAGDVPPALTAGTLRELAGARTLTLALRPNGRRPERFDTLAG
jgi:hypothetical protein